MWRRCKRIKEEESVRRFRRQMYLNVIGRRSQGIRLDIIEGGRYDRKAHLSIFLLNSNFIDIMSSSVSFTPIIIFLHIKGIIVMRILYVSLSLTYTYICIHAYSMHHYRLYIHTYYTCIPTCVKSLKLWTAGSLAW